MSRPQEKFETAFLMWARGRLFLYSIDYLIILYRGNFLTHLEINTLKIITIASINESWVVSYQVKLFQDTWALKTQQIKFATEHLPVKTIDSFITLNRVSFASSRLSKSKYCAIVSLKKLFDNILCSYIKYIFLRWFHSENVHEAKSEGFGFL